MTEGARLRFYDDLARWWPLISPVEDYAAEAPWIAALLRRARIPVVDVLELGCGGGHLAHWLTREFTLTLTDLAPAMLDCSRALNPACEHRLGDMRSLRLDRDFDAVLVHDAVDYLVDVDGLRALAATAVAHLRPGGVVVIVPDEVRETYEPGSESGGTDAPDGSGVRFLEWSGPAAPDATVVRTDYAFLIREADGRVEVVHDVHETGLFPMATWLAVLRDAGLVAEAVPEPTDEARTPRTAFVGLRPAG